LFFPTNKKTVPAPLKVALFAANTGSPFEDEHLEAPFVDLLKTEVQSSGADLVILHFQEMCGKNWKNRDTKDVSHKFAAKLLSILPEYWTPGLMFHAAQGEKDNNFTALATIGLVRKTAVEQDRVSIWNFKANKAVTLSELQESHNSDTEAFYQSAAFSSKQFPEIKAGRKGYLHTRWIVDENPMDMVNVHMFHDANNVETLDDGYPSVYAKCRARAFQLVVNACNLQQCKNVFVFGDFNFRLDMSAVVSDILGQNPVRTEEGSDEKKFVTLRDAKDVTRSIRVGTKVFEMNPSDTFVKDWSRFLRHDHEPTDATAKLGFTELQVDFPPSYPFEEEVGVTDQYMQTRCPGWCDRVLMNTQARTGVSGATYGLVGLDKSIGDHKPVVLKFDWLPARE
jgi:inositol-1,4,5-trisphosphate 5-phosphatase